MLIRYRGHSEFVLQAGRVTLVTDPFDAHVGYRMEDVAADAVLVSHGHGDHAFTEKVKGDPAVITGPGSFCPAPGVKVTGIRGCHDDQGGALRGENTVYVIEWEGLRLLHLGDQGCALTEEQKKSIGRVDILFVPVGGFFTMDGALAARTREALGARVTVPMHYKTRVNASWPISDESLFLERAGAENAPRVPLLRVTEQDISELPPVVVMTPECL